jgi:hypothetical protein
MMCLGQVLKFEQQAWSFSKTEISIAAPFPLSSPYQTQAALSWIKVAVGGDLDELVGDYEPW